MAKPMKWIGKTASDETLTGEGYDENDCRLRAESMGAVSFTCEENPEYTLQDEIEASMPEVVSFSARDAKGEDTVQHLAEANAKMFEQLNGMKNAVSRAKDLAAMVIAMVAEAETNAKDSGNDLPDTMLGMRAIAIEIANA